MYHQEGGKHSRGGQSGRGRPCDPAPSKQHKCPLNQLVGSAWVCPSLSSHLLHWPSCDRSRDLSARSSSEQGLCAKWEPQDGSGEQCRDPSMGGTWGLPSSLGMCPAGGAATSQASAPQLLTLAHAQTHTAAWELPSVCNSRATPILPSDPQNPKLKPFLFRKLKPSLFPCGNMKPGKHSQTPGL